MLIRRWLLMALAVAGCDPDSGGPGATSAAPASSKTLIEADDEPMDAGAQKKGTATKAGERVAISGGKLIAGSTPGDRGRDPSLEPALLEVELSAFEIDKLPYPNDPSLGPRTGVTRDEAARLCDQAKGRLCSELEWERACKGVSGQTYAGGNKWDDSCAKAPETCASEFGVLAMGGAMREWTASDIEPIPKLQPEAAAVRGAAAADGDVDHRCAHRRGVAPDTTSADLGFRCCYGATNAATVASPKWLDTVKRTQLPPDKLAELFKSNARLKRLSNDVKYFREEAAEETVMRRGRARGTDAGALPDNTYMTTSPVIWNPTPGEEILIVTGRSGEKDSFIVAFHRVPGGRYRVGSAMIMEGELGPVVIVYNPYVRRKLHWTTCWECYGETGNITYREENRVVITQK